MDSEPKSPLWERKQMVTTMVLQDGRILCFAEYGDPAGRPVFFFHAAGSSRLHHPQEKILQQRGISTAFSLPVGQAAGRMLWPARTTCPHVSQAEPSLPAWHRQSAPIPTATCPSPPAATATPTTTPAPAPSPMQLVVLHTNDNWGETEPCG